MGQGRAPARFGEARDPPLHMVETHSNAIRVACLEALFRFAHARSRASRRDMELAQVSWMHDTGHAGA
jgi:hypothetical protein